MPAAQAEPLTAHRLSAAEITELVQTHPVWCMGRSNDGTVCEGVAGLSYETDGTKQFWYLLLAKDLDGKVEKIQRRTVVEIKDGGLCSSLEQMADTKILHFPAGNDLANLDAEGPPSNDEKFVWLARIESEWFRMNATDHGVRSGEKICMQIDQVGIGYQHYVMTPVWASGTEREYRGSRDAVAFEALANDPGFRLGK